jgi:hypothetical protein
MTDGAFGPVCFSEQLQARREPAQGDGTGFCVLAEWMIDGAFGPVFFSTLPQAGESRPKEQDFDAAFWRNG